MNKLNDIIQNAQTIRSGENSNSLLETYKKSVMPHERHISLRESDIAMDTMCAYQPPQHEFPHWKGVFCCCSNCPHIDIICQ